MLKKGMKINSTDITNEIMNKPIDTIITLYYTIDSGNIGIAIQYKKWLDSPILLIGGYGNSVTCIDLTECFNLEELESSIKEGIENFMTEYGITYFITE